MGWCLLAGNVGRSWGFPLTRAVYCSLRSRGRAAAASQVLSLSAKTGCKSQQRKRGLEKCSSAGATTGKGCWPCSFHRFPPLSLRVLTLHQRDRVPGWKSKEHANNLAGVAHRVNLSLISVIGSKSGILTAFLDRWLVLLLLVLDFPLRLKANPHSSWK